MTTSEGAAARFDHLVVVMFENRSFDHLLGYLYRPGEVASFEGVAGKTLSNPLPASVDGRGTTTVPVHPAESMDMPDPNPGEEFPHVNTQLYGIVRPEANRLASLDQMSAPYNQPEPLPGAPSMSGFVEDYAAEYQLQMGRVPSLEECAQIMACYTPPQLPVLSTLAREFACFDHWFCEVPTETYPNRSFVHAASSSGFVLNHPPGKFELENDAPTIFERLEGAGRSWKVYVDPGQLVSATALIHARRLAPYFATHFSTTYDFVDDAAKGTLPEYAFIEPNMFVPHSDMHPPGASKLRHLLHAPSPEALIRGEQFLARIYDAVRTSSNPTGSNFANTLLLVLFDEHGGTYDHLPPPAVSPPADSARRELGFTFDRSGLRVPAIAVSAWVEPHTVVTAEYRHTSVIRTLRQRWALGPPLTARDAGAADIGPVLTCASPRPAGTWPVVAPPPLSPVERIMEELERPLSPLERDILGGALAHEARAAGLAPPGAEVTASRTEARQHLTRIRDAYFPGIAKGRQR